MNRYEAKIDLPDFLKDFFQALREYAYIYDVDIDSEKITLHFDEKDDYDLALVVKELENEVAANLQIYLDIARPHLIEVNE